MVAVLAAAGCTGETVDPDRAHEQRAALHLSADGKVECEAAMCKVRTIQALPTKDQAWFIALPLVAGVDSDPDLKSISGLELELLNKEGTHAAQFTCSLPHAGGDLVSVEFVHENCTATFSGF